MVTLCCIPRIIAHYKRTYVSQYRINFFQHNFMKAIKNIRLINPKGKKKTLAHNRPHISSGANISTSLEAFAHSAYVQ